MTKRNLNTTIKEHERGVKTSNPILDIYIKLSTESLILHKADSHIDTAVREPCCIITRKSYVNTDMENSNKAWFLFLNILLTEN